MKRFVLFATLALALVAVTALADSRPQMLRGSGGVHTGQAVGMSKALGDTVYLVGNPQNADQGAIENGTFQTAAGSPAWNGWTTEDVTAVLDEYWQVSEFRAVNGNYSYWCGTLYGDDNYGYGNDWNYLVQFTHEVSNPAIASSVVWTATVQQDSEPAYDFTFMEWNNGGIWEALAQYDGRRTYNFSSSWTINPGQYAGSGDDEIQLRIRFTSDGGWSDQDGLYLGDGACQIDDITVTVNGVLVESEDFEDGQAQNWPQVFAPFVGDFAQLYTGLQDEDLCTSNITPQVAFVDDGVVVPGTGGTDGQTWRYGPGAYIVNNTGGLAGPDYYIHNGIISPVLEWPAGAEAAYVQFGVYRHEELGSGSIWPGMFYTWQVRSVNTGNPADIEFAAWRNRNFVQYGGPDYLRQTEVVTDLLENGRTHMQMSLRVYELGYAFGWTGTDGTPAPYFDNVAVVAYPFLGPGIAGRPIDWHQDDFPHIEEIDLGDLGRNSVRLDAAQNIADEDDLVNVPGDSVWFDISAVRGGSVLVEYPQFHVRMRANPLFDAYRILPPNFSSTPNFFTEEGFENWTLIEGYVDMDSTFLIVDDEASYIADRWEVDLPDENFFYPGDVLKWYVRAQDDLNGDIGTTLLPADTSGFSSFIYNLDYPVDFIVRALPTIRDAGGDQPTVLFWNDFVDRGADNEWNSALNQLGYKMGVDYDMFATSGPSSGVGNGLGSRATSVQLAGYSTLLYNSGDLSANLLGNGDFEADPSDDIAVLRAWFNRGNKNALFTGDEFVRGVLDAGVTGLAFVQDFLSVNFVQNAVGPLIGQQTTPLVKSVPSNGIVTVNEWIAYGGCLGINSFDAVIPVGGAQRIAEWTDTNGNAGQYTYAAGVFNVGPNNARVVYLPYDLAVIHNAPGYTPPAGYAGIPARAILLEEILIGFGEDSESLPTGVELPANVLSVSNFPNPFNPSTTIKMNLPKAGDVSLKVFNVRGELVKTLVDGPMIAGEHSIVWDGKTDGGNQTASGVYFYETRANGEVKINKMALVK